MTVGCFSYKRPKTLNTIRVVHLDGSLEDYEDPVTTDQVVGNFPKYFLCSPIEILQIGLVPLKLDHRLKTGQIYFLLPNSTLKFSASPADLTALTRKLTNIAKSKTGQCLAKSAPTSPSASPLRDPKPSSDMVNVGSLNRSAPWKPALATIREGSFNHRS